jgi:hypothetical protein
MEAKSVKKIKLVIQRACLGKATSNKNKHGIRMSTLLGIISCRFEFHE